MNSDSVNGFDSNSRVTSSSLSVVAPHSPGRTSSSKSDHQPGSRDLSRVTNISSLPGYSSVPCSRKYDAFKPITQVHSLDDTDSLIELQLNNSKGFSDDIFLNSITNPSRQALQCRSPGNLAAFLNKGRSMEQRKIAPGRNANGSLTFDSSSPNCRPFSANTFCEPAPFNSPSVVRSNRRAPVNGCYAHESSRVSSRPQSSSAQLLRQSSIRFFRGSLRQDLNSGSKSGMNNFEPRQIQRADSQRKCGVNGSTGFDNVNEPVRFSGNPSNPQQHFATVYRTSSATVGSEAAVDQDHDPKQIELNRHHSFHSERNNRTGIWNEQERKSAAVSASQIHSQLTSEIREVQLINEIEAMRREFDLQLMDLKEEWHRRHYCQQQTAFRAESKLLDQIKKLQDDRKAFQEKLEKTLVENESLRHSVAAMEGDIKANITQMDHLKKELHASTLERNNVKEQLERLSAPNPSSPLPATTARPQSKLIENQVSKDISAIRDLNSELEEELERLRKALNGKNQEIQAERDVWLEEKKKVISYQKQLQQNYMQTVEQNESLQIQVERLKTDVDRLKIELQTSSSDVSK